MKILLLAVVALVGALLFLQLPEIRRYLKMRNM
jgi:hypothetical protein